MATAKKTTTSRGLGWRHQQARTVLMRRHADGTPCWWCALAMYRDDGRNWDGRTLAADHTLARAHGGTRADRLMHSTCNGQRGDGSRDHQRPALMNLHPSTWSTSVAQATGCNLGDRLMPWP